MFDSSLAVPLHFTVEFVGFLVAAGGAFLIASRPSLVPGDPGRRRLVAFGFVALATVHVLHGGAFVPADGEETLALVRAMGFALILVGVTGRATPAPASAAATFTVRDPLPLVPGALALLAAAAAFAGSFRGGPRTHRRLALGLFFMALSEMFVSVAPKFEFGVGEGNVYAYTSHAIKILGYLAVGSWLWSSVRLSIRTRFVASFVTLLVAVVLALATTLTGVIANQVEAEELRRVEIQLGAALGGFEDDQLKLLDGVESIAANDDVREGLTRGVPSQAQADALISNSREFYNADFVIVDTPRDFGGFAGDYEGRSKRGQFVIQILGSDVVVDLLEAKETDRSGDIQKVRGNPRAFPRGLVMLAAAEIDHRRTPNRRAGIVVLGRYISDSVIDRISADFQPARASLIVNDRTVASQLPRSVQRADLVPDDVEPRLDAGEIVHVRQSFGNRSYFTALAPVRDVFDVPLGVLALSTPDAAIVADTRESVTRALFLVAMAAAAIAMVLAWYSGRRITRPIQQLTLTAREVREGNLAAQAPVGGEDEVGQLGETFNEMTLSMLRLTEDLRLAAREEEQLRGRIETIIESMADGLVAVDEDKNVLAFNREAQQLTGRSQKEVLGRPVEDVVRLSSAKGERVRIPVYDLGAGSNSGVFLQRPGQESVPVAVTSAVIRDEFDRVAGAVAVIRDMTREREVERMKSEFLSNISHELRTPLTPIKGYAEILGRKDVPPDKLKRFTQGILESTARLERIVELLVDFSSMEAGRLAPKSTPVDIADMVRRLGQDTEARTPRHDVVVDIKARLPKVVGDERLLKRSLEEVLDNAVKFSPDGGTIKLEVRGVAAGNGQRRRRGVAVSVSDQGIGIDPENLERIFSDFQQVDGSETRAYGGLGLGLAFVQRIVEAHDGRVDVDSTPEEGTRFTITLPGASAGANK